MGINLRCRGTTQSAEVGGTYDMSLDGTCTNTLSSVSFVIGITQEVSCLGTRKPNPNLGTYPSEITFLKDRPLIPLDLQRVLFGTL